MAKLRLRFSKTGKAVWISHLDLMRTMQRALMRAEIPLEYSFGFNPHAVMSIAMPLSVGMSSECELMDFGVSGYMEPDTITARLNAALPEGVEALEVYEGMEKFNGIKYLRFEARLEYASGDFCGELRDLLSAPSLVIDKKTKRGLNPTDIAPFIVRDGLTIEPTDGGVLLSGILSVPDVSPAHLIQAIKQLRPGLAPEAVMISRREMLRADFSVFR